MKFKFPLALCFTAVFGNVLSISFVQTSEAEEASPRVSQGSKGAEKETDKEHLFYPKELIDILKITPQKEGGGDINADVKELVDLCDVVLRDEPQSNRFYEKAVLFSKKYRHTFPFGEISSKALGLVHIGKSATDDLVFEMRKASDKNGTYTNLWDLSRLFYEGAGYLGVKAGRRDDALAVLEMSVLMRVEHDLNSGSCFYQIEQDMKKSRIYSDFMNKNKKQVKEVGDEHIKSISARNERDIRLKQVVQSIREKIEMGQAVGDKEWNDFSNALTEFGKKGVGEKGAGPIDVYFCITRIWEIKSIAKSLKNDKMGAEAVKVLEWIKTDSPYSLAKRWASEALLVDKEKVRKRYIFVKELIISPDGEITGYKDADGKSHEYTNEDTEF